MHVVCKGTGKVVNVAEQVRTHANAEVGDRRYMTRIKEELRLCLWRRVQNISNYLNSNKLTAQLSKRNQIKTKNKQLFLIKNKTAFKAAYKSSTSKIF